MAALLVTSARTLSAATVLSCVQEHGLDSATTRLLTSFAAGDQGESAASADLVVSFAHSPELHSSRALLAELLRVLRPDGKLVLDEPHADASRREALRGALLLAGFVGGEAGVATVSARKPSWKAGSSFSLRSAARPPAPAAPVWLVGGDDQELIDDEALLTEEDLKRPPRPLAADDCEVGAAGRKACANCSCGRAEAEAKVLVSDASADVNAAPPPSSACGSCYLGDAFRCSTCPYLGKPAFKPGEKVVLSI